MQLRRLVTKTSLSLDYRPARWPRLFWRQFTIRPTEKKRKNRETITSSHENTTTRIANASLSWSSLSSSSISICYRILVRIIQQHRQWNFVNLHRVASPSAKRLSLFWFLQRLPPKLRSIKTYLISQKWKKVTSQFLYSRVHKKRFPVSEAHRKHLKVSASEVV